MEGAQFYQKLDYPQILMELIKSINESMTAGDVGRTIRGMNVLRTNLKPYWDNTYLIEERNVGKLAEENIPVYDIHGENERKKIIREYHKVTNLYGLLVDLAYRANLLPKQKVVWRERATVEEIAEVGEYGSASLE